MPTLFEFSQTIRNLNKEKKFSETLKFFKDNKTEFRPEEIGLNKFVVYEMISALIETNHYDVIFTFIEQHNVVLDEKNFGYLLKKFKDKPSVNWTVVNKFCDLISVENLDTDCKTIEVERKGEKKPMELASDKENWFAFKTKALFETQQYQECFELSKKALETFEKFHYSNEVWFARRIALSKKHLGNSEEALNELLQVLRRKKEWFIQNEVAEIYKENGEFDKAFKYAIEAINNFGDLEYKVGLLVLIANILEQKQEKELSFKHYMLSKLLRQQEEWKVPQTLDYALQNLGFAQIPLEQLPNLKRELKNYWNTFKQEKIKPFDKTRTTTNQNFEGEIVRLLHDNERGKVGFIKSNGKEHYFSVNPNYHSISEISVGTKVIFEILPPKDDKKDQTRIKKIIA
ncbi:tetratricopeptide repeat protein [Faecalibacter rhinopitheci]|uniref:Tetratricopeptide repeat protein n=1 Tax=Faecalibacter rhinopitheci TaxID=2779678 RepID=A0A8J7G7V8_9FLAO|nr:tetratricopeptide repeat protein [Faecalibacter rhinopitheci]MBF0598397.1 tetratricopeptide repeat protein [Faecalibacter rhinopitheci]